MKLCYRRQPDVGSAGFHYRKAVAPLKLCYRRQPDVGSAGFHYRKAVAPLKSSGVRCKAAVTASFHYRKAVAPLKCRLVLRRNAAGRRFPLPKGGGPIEGVDSGRGQNRTLSPLSVRMPSCAAMKRRTFRGMVSPATRIRPGYRKAQSWSAKPSRLCPPRRTRICSMSSADSV